MRYYLIFTVFLLTHLQASPTSASTWKEAAEKAKAEQKDILLLVHGSNWNRLGEKFKQQIWVQEKFKNQLGDGFVILSVDYLDAPNEEEKKKFDTVTKGLKMKFRSYPALALYDPEGRHYATWTGSDFPLMTSQAVSMITHKQSQRKKRDAFLIHSKELKGVKKAELLYLAIETDAGLRKETLKQLKETDPDNQSGYLSLLEFSGRNALGHANKLAGEKKFDEALTWLDEQWAQPKLNTEQKQWILAAKGNVYRRWGGHLNEMNEVFMAAYKLDPKSITGKASYRFAKRFSGPPSLEFGWDSRHCTASPAVWKVDAQGVFQTPGEYQVTLKYHRGKSSLSIASVALYDGEQLIVVDQHDGDTGRASKNNVYSLSTTKKLKHPILHILCNTNDTKNSQGLIQVSPVIVQP